MPVVAAAASSYISNDTNNIGLVEFYTEIQKIIIGALADGS